VHADDFVLINEEGSTAFHSEVAPIDQRVIPAIGKTIVDLEVSSGSESFSVGNDQIGPAPRIWIPDPTTTPWFEKPDAEQQASDIAIRWGLGSQGVEWLDSWVQNGYFVVDDAVSETEIEAFSAKIDDAWYRETPFEGMSVSDVVVDGVKSVHTAHSDLLALPLEVRQRAKKVSNWRIGEYHLHERAALEIFRSERLRLICCAILDRPDIQPHFSLTFSKGSRQLLHQDTAVFHTWPLNALIGVWIAAEDIREDSGPLEYYPGSHRVPLFHEFDNYPQTQRRTALPEQAARYDNYVFDLATKFPRKTFTPKKGAALFWHGMLIHGGAPVLNDDTTRKSMVIHYMPDGSNRGADIVGPLNW